MILNIKATENVTKVREQNFKLTIFSKLQSGHFLQTPQIFIFSQAIVLIVRLPFIGFNDRDSAPNITEQPMK